MAARSDTVVDPTSDGSAKAGKDYTAESGMLTWANGDATPRVINVPISKVTAFAGTKTLAFALAHAENVVMGTPASTIVTMARRIATSSRVTRESSPSIMRHTTANCLPACGRKSTATVTYRPDGREQ